jgi:D-sedoheptulose 7-phosphate isomerase
MKYVGYFLRECVDAIQKTSLSDVIRMVDALSLLRDSGGRLFLIGVGGSSAAASHAACDFRKLCNIECYCVSDNVPELTARVNDDGWDTSYSRWLKSSNLALKDAIMVISVGGGNSEKNVSPNICKSVDYARSVAARIYGIVGRDGGYTALYADPCIIVPNVDPELTTPLTEGLQSVILHLLCSHPQLQKNTAKWESVK